MKSILSISNYLHAMLSARRERNSPGDSGENNAKNWGNLSFVQLCVYFKLPRLTLILERRIASNFQISLLPSGSYQTFSFDIAGLNATMFC